MKKIFCLFFALLIFVSCITPSYAEVFLNEKAYDITKSSVEEDLARTYINGKIFDEADYPLSSSADYFYLINMIEYGYSPSSGDQFGLYFYVYNPSGDKIIDGMHSVELSVADDFYGKYLLKVIDVSDDNRFIKFRLLASLSVYSLIKSDKRVYNLSGLEIETKAGGIRDFVIGGTFTFTGSQYDYSLECKTDVLQTIELDLHSTFYRLDTSDKGEYYQSQLDAVYFSLDNWLMKKYGEVYSIQGKYTEQLFTTFVSRVPYFTNLEQCVASGLTAREYYNCGMNPLNIYPCAVSRDDLIFYDYRWNWGMDPNITFLTAIFYRPDENSFVTAEEKLAFADKYDMWTKSEIYWLQDPEKNYRFRPRYCNFDITINDSFELLSFYSNHEWYEKCFEYGLFTGIFGIFEDDEIRNIEAIVPVTKSDLPSDNFDLSKDFLIDENDVDDFREYVSSADENGKTTYLFRFKTQDYLSVPMAYHDSNNVASVLSNSYYTEEIAYHNFDILSITFRDEDGRFTILPSVSDPIDIVADSTPPVNYLPGMPDFSNLKRIIAIVLIVLAVIVVIWVISKALPKRVKVVSSKRRRR